MRWGIIAALVCYLFLVNFMAETTAFGSEARCREIAIREYPNNPSMQRYIYEQQFAACQAMNLVKDQEVKKITLHEYPNDYSMQKYIYDEQLAAKNYMKTVQDKHVKKIALPEYRNDYSMQK